jgi:hypothetical protein
VTPLTSTTIEPRKTTNILPANLTPLTKANQRTNTGVDQMKKLFAIIATAAVAAVASAQTVTNLFPDGDFDHPAGTNGPWVETGGGTVWSYPTTGGNPGGYGVMDGTLGWGIWVGGNTTPLPLGPLGLVAGNSYDFTMDMNQFSLGNGTHPAGLKIESWGPGGKISDSGDMTTPTAPGWQTYLFNYTIAPGATGLKVVPLWEAGGVDGYDNIGVVVPPQPLLTAILSPDGTLPEPTNFTITATAVVSPGVVTNVVFYDGATVLGHSATYPYNFNVVGASVGIHPLTVVAQANTGISATSAVVNVTVAQLAPPAPNYPTNTPATPTTPATEVIALYNSSGVYADHSPINWYPWGGGGSRGDFVVANGKVVKSYLALQYAGVEVNGGIYDLAHALDISGMNTLHIDVWTTANQMAIKMVSSAANGAAPEVIYDAASGVITASNWVRLDIPLAVFTNLNSALDLTHIDQLLWVDNGDIAGPGVQNGDFYFDNIYFYSNAVPIIPPGTPIITSAPTNVTVLLGADAALTVAASGDGLNYQWQLNGTNLIEGGAVSGSTSPLLTLSGCALSSAGQYRVIVSNSFGSASQTNTLKVIDPTAITLDPTAGWLGYMNVFNLPSAGGGYQFGQAWGTADLCATFSGSQLTLSPNTIGDANAYWYVGGGAPGHPGNKQMDASMYVETTGLFVGTTITFTGNVLSDTLVGHVDSQGNGWSSVAFIKDFAPDYSSSVAVTAPLVNGVFSLSLATINDPNRHVQYGFETVGPCVWASDPALPGYGNVILQPVVAGVPATVTVTAGLSGGQVHLTFPTQTGYTYTVQYKVNLADHTWSTLTAASGTGSAVTINDSTAAQAQRFYRVSAQ